MSVLPRVILCVAVVFASSAAYATDAAAADQAYGAGRHAARDGRSAEAIAAFERALELDPRHIDARLHLGIAHSRMGDWRAAQTAYESLLQIVPDHARALHNLGNVLYRRGRLEPAADAYGRAREADPGYLLAAYHHGWMLRQLGRDDEAARALEVCLELPAQADRDRRTQLDCLFVLGTLRHRAGDYAAAAETMERVLRIAPDHAEARHYLGTAYRRLGRDDDARRELERHRQLVRSRRGPPVARDDLP